MVAPLPSQKWSGHALWTQPRGPLQPFSGQFLLSTPPSPGAVCAWQTPGADSVAGKMRAAGNNSLLQQPRSGGCLTLRRQGGQQAPDRASWQSGAQDFRGPLLFLPPSTSTSGLSPPSCRGLSAATPWPVALFPPPRGPWALPPAHGGPSHPGTLDAAPSPALEFCLYLPRGPRVL